MTLADRIKSVRTHKGLSQKELANRIDITDRTLKRYEKDSSNISVSIVTKISQICQVNEVWLLTGRGKMLSIDNLNLDKSEIENENYQNKGSAENNIIAVDHYDMVNNFQDQTRAKQINRNLLKIEQQNKQAFRDIDNYIKGIVNGLKYSNQEQHLKNNDRDDPKKDGNGTAGNKMKKVNEG